MPSFLGEEIKARTGQTPGLAQCCRDSDRDESYVFRLLQYSFQSYFVFFFHWVKISLGHNLVYPPKMNFENELGHGTVNLNFFEPNSLRKSSCLSLWLFSDIIR